MYGFRGILSVGQTGESHQCTSSEDSLSVDGSSSSTVVTDSVDSDSTPSPVLLGGLRLLQRRECGMQNKPKYSHVKTYDDSESSQDSEFILDPTNRFKGLILNEMGHKHIGVKALTDDSRTESLVKCDGSPGSDKVLIYQTNGTEDKVEDEEPLSTIPNFPQDFRVHLATQSLNVLRSDSHASPSIEGIGKNLHDIHGPMSESYSERNPGGGIAIMDDIPVHPSSTGCETTIICAGGSYHTPCSVSDLTKFQGNLERPEKMRKPVGNSKQVHSYDSSEEVTQVDGSACMFSDSSPVQSPLAHFPFPCPIRSDIDKSEDQQTVECKFKTGINQETFESYDTSISFNEGQSGIISLAQFSSEVQLESSSVDHISTPTKSGTKSSDHPIRKDDFKCNEVGNMRKEDASVPNSSLEKFSTVYAVEPGEAQAIQKCLEDDYSAGTADVHFPNRSSDSEVMIRVRRGGKRKAVKRGKDGKRSSKTINQKGRDSENATSRDDFNEVTKRSQRMNAGIHRTDTIIHGRVLELRGEMTEIKWSQDRLNKSLTKPEKVIKDAGVVGQQLGTLQTKLRRIADDLKKTKNDLERTLFNLRFVYSQKKRKIYIEQELNNVKDIQQTLLARLKVHRQIASRLQDIIRKHSEELKGTRKKRAKQTLALKRENEETLGMTTGDGSGASFEIATEKAATCTATETITEEKQNTLLQQLVESLDDSEGNLLVRFMSMLQNKGNVELQSSDEKKALTSSGVTEERKSAAMKSINTESSIGGKGISPNLLKPARAEFFEDRHKFLVESSQKDRTLSSRGATMDSDLDNTPDEIKHSSSGDCGAELMSSSDDEVSVEPEAVGDVHDATDTLVSQSNCSLNKIKQTTSIEKVAPEMVKASENIMNTFPNSKSLGSSYSCPVSRDDQFGSLITDQKNVQSSPKQISNVLSSKEKSAHFRPPWKNLDSSAQRSSSGVQFKQDPSGGYKPTGKLQFGLGSIHNASLSENTKYLLTFQQEGKDVPNTRQRLSGPVSAPLQKAWPVSSTVPENTFDYEYAHNKQLSHIDGIIMKAANGSHFKGKAVVQGDTSTQHKPPDISKETPICCDRKDEQIGLNADNRRGSIFSGSCTKEVITTQPAYQIKCIPDMKLYHKVHLIEENELVPYTEILPKEIWTTDDIGLVEMPQEFIDEIDLW